MSRSAAMSALPLPDLSYPETTDMHIANVRSTVRSGGTCARALAGLRMILYDRDSFTRSRNCHIACEIYFFVLLFATPTNSANHHSRAASCSTGN